MRRLVVGAALLVTSSAPRIAYACAPAPAEGVHVAVAEESAIIVWDEATKTEHFIRRASFRSESRDFGFLVPTPTKPELGEASDNAFAALENSILPETVYTSSNEYEPTLLLLFFFARSSKSEAPTAAATVRVLETKRVGDYDTAVLEADDPGALGEWLKAHGYAKREALTEWLTPYVEKKWKLIPLPRAA